MPRLSASSLFSMIVTGIPALAKYIEMPPPIVPAPITAARLISRAHVLGDARHLRRFALGEENVALRLRLIARHEHGTVARSISSASSIGISSVMRIISMRSPVIQTARFLACCATISSNFAGSSRMSLSLSSRSFTRAWGRVSASILRANAPLRTGSPSMISSIRPAASASPAGIGSPDRIMGGGFSMPPAAAGVGCRRRRGSARA